MKRELAADPEAPRSVGPSPRREWLIGALWTCGLLFLSVATVAATVHLAAVFGPSIEQSWFSFPNAGSWLWAGLGLVAAAVVGLAVILRRLRGTREAWLLPSGLALVAITRIVAIVLIHPPLLSDWLKYYTLAQAVASGGPGFADVPTGYPIITGLLFRVFGANVLIGELVNLAAALATGWLVYQLANKAWGRRAGGVALYVYAVFISQLLMVTVFCTEVLFAASILAAVLLMLEATARRGWIGVSAAFSCGVLIGLSQYVRTDAEILLPAFLVLPLVARLPARQAVELAATCLAAFMLIMGPVILWNHATYGTWSVSTSNYGGWSLLVGTDPQNDGQYNAADLALLPADTTSRAFDEDATALALERLQAHPGRLLELAIRKIVPMWGNEDYAATWTLDQTNADLDQTRSAIALASQITYAGLLAAAATAAWLERRRRPAMITLIILVIGATAIGHILLEVQPRYHFVVEPMLCILAGGWLATRFQEVLPVRSSGSRSEPTELPAGLPTAG